MSDSIFLTNGRGAITGLVAGTSYEGELVIPEYVAGEKITAIGNSAFWMCDKLTSATIPDGVTSIGNSAFYMCDKLTSVTIPDGVTSIGEEAFYYCPGLTSVHIPDSVTSIGAMAFSNCEGLKSITIPNGVTSIEYSTFFYCIGLTSIIIPDNVTSIGEEAFSHCEGLKSITIPNGVTSIEYDTFYACIELTSVNIPNSVTSIGEEAFGNCERLKSVTIPNSVTSIGEDAFSYCSSLTTIYVDDPDNLSAAVSSYDWSETGSSGVIFKKYVEPVDMLITNSTLIDLGDKIRETTGATGTLTPVEMQSELDTFNSEMNGALSAQDDLIAQITAALEGKMVPSGGAEVETCKVTFTCSGLGSFNFGVAYLDKNLTYQEHWEELTSSSPVTIEAVKYSIITHAPYEGYEIIDNVADLNSNNNIMMTYFVTGDATISI